MWTRKWKAPRTHAMPCRTGTNIIWKKYISNETHEKQKRKRKKICKMQIVSIDTNWTHNWHYVGASFSSFSFLHFFFLSFECVLACASLHLVMHSTAFTFSPRARSHNASGSLLCVTFFTAHNSLLCDSNHWLFGLVPVKESQDHKAHRYFFSSFSKKTKILLLLKCISHSAIKLYIESSQC